MRHLVPDGSRALDYGCGTGHFARRLSRHYVVNGLDSSSAARDQTREIAPDVSVLGDVDEVPTRAFDLVTALHVLEHIPDPSPTIDRFAQWLKPSGYLFVVVPN